MLLIFNTKRICGFSSFQPDFAPPRVDTPGAEHAAATIAALADYRIQDDSRILHLLHLTGFLVDELVNAFQNLVCSTAIWYKFRIPSHTAILIVRVQCRENFSVRLDTNGLAGLQVKRYKWSAITLRYST